MHLEYQSGEYEEGATFTKQLLELTRLNGIEPTTGFGTTSKVPKAVRTLNAQMFPMLTEPWSIEFFEMVTPQKLEERNLT